MKIKTIPDATTIVVHRGYDGSTTVSHLENTAINLLNTADDNLVEPDDDFGFNGLIEDFTDSQQYG